MKAIEAAWGYVRCGIYLSTMQEYERSCPVSVVTWPVLMSSMHCAKHPNWSLLDRSAIWQWSFLYRETVEVCAYLTVWQRTVGVCAYLTVWQRNCWCTNCTEELLECVPTWQSDRGTVDVPTVQRNCWSVCLLDSLTEELLMYLLYRGTVGVCAYLTDWQRNCRCTYCTAKVLECVPTWQIDRWTNSLTEELDRGTVGAPTC